MALVRRGDLNRPLTIDEMDGNFDYLEGLSGGSEEKYSQIIFEITPLVLDYGIETFTTGELYQIPTVESGDDFTNIGYIDREPFIATGTTPTSFTNGTTVLRLSKELVYTIYKNTLTDFQLSREFDNFDEIYLSFTFSNFSTNYNSNLQINYTSNNSSRNVSYDTESGRYYIAATEGVIDLKVFNVTGITSSFTV